MTRITALCFLVGVLFSTSLVQGAEEFLTRRDLEESENDLESKHKITEQSVESVLAILKNLSAKVEALDHEMNQLKKIHVQDGSSDSSKSANKSDGFTGTGRYLKAPETLLEGLIVATSYGIFAISLPSLNQTKISNDSGYPVAFDWSSRKVYWTLQNVGIKRANPDGTDVELVVKGNLWTFALDSITGNFYYRHKLSQGIRVCNQSGSRCSIFAASQKYVFNIALHPHKSLIFWTNSTSTVRANMDGTDARVIIPKRVPKIHVDEYSDRLNWIDNDLKIITSCDLNGNDQRVILNTTRGDLSGFAVQRDMIYFGTFGGGIIHSVDTRAFNSSIIGDMTGKVWDIELYGSKSYFRPNPCANATCSHLCVLKLESFACLCPPGNNLHRDGETCM